MLVKAKKLKKEFGVTYKAYGDTVIYKNYLYPLRRKIFIFKNLKRSSGLRIEPYGGTAVIKIKKKIRDHVSSRTGVRLFIKRY